MRHLITLLICLGPPQSSDLLAARQFGLSYRSTFDFKQKKELHTLSDGLQAIGKARSIDSASMSRMKTRTVSEAFRARAPLRKLLRSQCMKHADQCVHMEPQMLHSHNAGAFSQTVMQNDKSAWFSLQPPGDSAASLLKSDIYSTTFCGHCVLAQGQQELLCTCLYIIAIVWKPLYSIRCSETEQFVYYIYIDVHGNMLPLKPHCLLVIRLNLQLEHSCLCVHWSQWLIHTVSSLFLVGATTSFLPAKYLDTNHLWTVQMRTSLYNSILAGAIPAVFDDQLGKVLPFSDSIQWDQLVIQISPEKITKKGQDIVELLEVRIPWCVRSSGTITDLQWYNTLSFKSQQWQSFASSLHSFLQ